MVARTRKEEFKHTFTLVISSTLHRFLRAGIVSLTFVLLMFLFHSIF